MHEPEPIVLPEGHSARIRLARRVLAALLAMFALAGLLTACIALAYMGKASEKHLGPKGSPAAEAGQA